jgi:peptidoglycan/LPS O-acetylase OafA/YrhL
LTQTTTVTPRLGYRPALDGLRALAVLAVIAHHASPTLLPGGFLGVDVFFVLSGFLITALLLEEWEKTGRIGLLQFYRRRALRLFPALGAMLVVLGALSLVVGGEQMELTRRAVLPVALYVANWAEAFGADLGGLQHMWSLAIEEQFYLVWPVVLIGLLRLRGSRRAALLVAVAGAAAVVLLREAAVDAGVAAPRVYAGLDTRADGVLIGCALALARSLGVVPLVLRNRYAAAGGFAVLAVLTLSWRPSNIHNGFLAAELAAAAIVAYALANPGDRTVAWLETGWLVRVGKLSYGLYLWHWPVFYFLDVQAFPGRAGLAVALSFAAAMLSARFVERPFLARRRRPDQSPAPVVLRAA